MADSRETNDTPERGDPKPGNESSKQRLLAASRRMKILEWLQEDGSARVRDLSVAFAVSQHTIRLDLERLDADGYVVREHGGARLKYAPQRMHYMPQQHLTNMDRKKRIGRTAAALVGNGETIILDSGSTTTEIANNLTGHQDLNVITNAVNIALLLGALPSMSVYLPGGLFRAPTLSLTGEKSTNFFTDIFAEKLFLATAAISFETGLTFPDMAELYVKRAMIKAASNIYLVADSTKIGRTSFSALGPIELIGGFITDEGISEADREAFEKRGIKVIIAS